ncbi:MAG: YgjV family protein [Rhizobacter sp.]|nr:YgjV family protein [Ferruginibacter sp.]
MLQQIASYFGYLASLCLVISLVVNNDLKFRWFNSIGCLAFIVYAVFLSAIPVLITNAILLCINIYYLLKIYTKKENFELLEFKRDEKLASKFIDFYWKDINAYFPGFKPERLQGNLNFVVIRDVVIANIFSAALAPNGDAIVALNYTLPKYRDYKVGTFIFEKEKDYLISKGVKRIVYSDVVNKGHIDFLKVSGFVLRNVDGNEWYVKDI